MGLFQAGWVAVGAVLPAEVTLAVKMCAFGSQNCTQINCTHIKFSALRARRRRILPPMDEAPPDKDLAPQMADMASEIRDLSSEVKISKELEALLARGLHSAKLPQVMRSARAAEAFQQAFEIIGGIPRLAIWADANPDKFFPLYARMMTQTIDLVLREIGRA